MIGLYKIGLAMFQIGLLLFPNACISDAKVPSISMEEQIIARATSHGKINYRLGCDGRKPCKPNSFDCSGIIGEAWRFVGYHTGRKLNGFTMYSAGFPIKYTDAKRGDYVWFDAIHEGKPNHLALISRGRSGGTIEILDTVAKPGFITPRQIKITNGFYAGKFKIHTMRLDYSYGVAINKATGKPYRFKK